MANNESNGMLWALGAVGALALGGMVASRAGSRSGGCEVCGRSMGRGSFAKKPADQGYLQRQRYDAKAGFVVPLAKIEAINKVRGSFFENVYKDVRAALSKGGLQGSAFVAMEEAQRARMESYGMGPVKGMVGYGIVQPPRLIEDYVKEKVGDWAQGARRRAREAAAKSGTPVAQIRTQQMDREALRFAADLYVKRAWTLYVCEKTGHLQRDTRRSVYGKGEPLYEGVTFQLVLPAASHLNAPVGLTGAAKPMVLPETKRTKKVVDAEDNQNEAVAEALEDAGADADARMLRKMDGMPYLQMKKDGQPVGLYFIADIGSMYFSLGMQFVPLLTTTSKMASPSFGIPAGRLAKGGTCQGASVMSQTAIAQLGGVERRICTVCYATSANYGYANNMTQQEARRLWVTQLLQTSGSEACGYNLAAMIEAYARHTKHTDRKNQEIGVWNGEGIVVPGKEIKGVPKYADPTPLQISQLGGRPVPENTQDFFRKRKTSTGSVTGFFRIHDSGDFGVGNIARLITYTEAWGVAAKLLPNVFFWAPSRVWAVTHKFDDLKPAQLEWYEKNLRAAKSPGRITYETRDFVAVGSANQTRNGSANEDEVVEAVPAGMAPGEDTLGSLKSDEVNQVVNVPAKQQSEALKRLAELPNFTLRPSGLYIKRAEGEPVVIPVIEGMVGSGVAAQVAPNVYPSMVDSNGVEAWQCPVYTKQEVLGGKEAKSCRAANCRACWLAKELPVFYGAH